MEYAQALLHELRGIDCTLILEPGRVIVGNAGILVTKVLYVKTGDEKNFIIVDGAMNDLIRRASTGLTRESSRCNGSIGGKSWPMW